MKRLGFLITAILTVTLVVGALFIIFECGSVKGWQTITFPKVGTMQIPPQWRYYEEDDCAYIVDENDSLIMFQSRSYPKSDSSGIEESNKYLEGIQCKESLYDCTFGNSACYGKMLISYNGTEYEKFYIDLGDEERIQLIVWSDSVDEKTVKKIAKTYVLS